MIVIPYEILSMKNSKQIRQKKGLKTKDGLTYLGNISFVGSKGNVILQKKLITLFMAKNRDKWLKEIEGKPTPYLLCYKLYRMTNREFDYNNITQIVFDCMQKPRKGQTTGAHWIDNDNMNYIQPIACGWEKDENNPRMEFFIADKEQKKILENVIFCLHN